MPDVIQYDMQWEIASWGYALFFKLKTFWISLVNIRCYLDVNPTFFERYGRQNSVVYLLGLISSDGTENFWKAVYDINWRSGGTVIYSQCKLPSFKVFVTTSRFYAYVAIHNKNLIKFHISSISMIFFSRSFHHI